MVIDRLRHNLLSAQPQLNPALMADFEANTSALFSMLSALPCQMPPLPSNCSLNLPPGHRSHKDSHSDGSASVEASDGSNGFQAGVTFPLHPSSNLLALSSQAFTGSAEAPRSSIETSDGSSAMMTDAASAASLVAMEAQRVPLVSPANPLKALPPGQPNPPLSLLL